MQLNGGITEEIYIILFIHRSHNSVVDLSHLWRIWWLEPYPLLQEKERRGEKLLGYALWSAILLYTIIE
jgi:hypothetical protein